MKTVYDVGHQVFRDRQERRAESQLELPRFHLHLTPFEIRLMRFFWIEQSRRLDVRGDFHKVVVLFQDRDKRRASCAEDFGGKGFFHSGIGGASVALGETFQLLVESEEIAALIRQGDAKTRQCFRRGISLRACRFDLSVEPCKERHERVDVRPGQTEHAAHLCGFRRRRVQALRQTVDALTCLHRVVRDVEQSRARREYCHKSCRLGVQNGHAFRQAVNSSFGG